MVDLPFQKVLGNRVGAAFRDTHADNGVQFRLGALMEGFVGENGHVTGVQIANEALPADFVVIGVGVRPATDFLKDSGVQAERERRLG